MSFGVDTLAALTEKLKQLINDTQNKYESFIDDTQLYKQGKINEKDFFAKMGEYLVATSAMNFLAIRVILEIKSTIEKDTSMKSPTGGAASPTPSPQAAFGIGGFVGTGGIVGSGPVGKEQEQGQYTLPTPQQASQQEPTFKPVESEINRPSKQQVETTTQTTKNCIVCGSAIPRQAKFCNKCGNSQ
jgi:hypothetical protein